MLLSEKEARSICERVFGYVRADDAQVSVDSEDYSHLRFAANAFTTSGQREETNVRVTTWIGKKKGTISTTEIDGESLQAAVGQAEEIARRSPVDREYLPTLKQQHYKAADGYREATAQVSLNERAKAISDVLNECERNKTVGAGFHQAQGTATALATKNGNFVYNRSSVVGLSITARTPDGSGSGYFQRNHFDVAKLNVQRLAREAIQKALRSRGARAIDAGRYTVILEPQAVADLLTFLPLSFNARSADEGRSPYSLPGGKTRLGEKIFDERIQVYSDPQHPELPGAIAAQGGLPAQKFYLVRNGVLENLIYTRFWAMQKQREPSPGPVNSILESSAAGVSIDEMIKSTDRGLIVSRFWYIRSLDPRTISLTGLTRDGVWFIERGEIKHPVRNFRFNQSVLQMLAPGNVELVGAPERVNSSMMMPALKIKQFNFTSQSEAV